MSDSISIRSKIPARNLAIAIFITKRLAEQFAPVLEFTGVDNIKSEVIESQIGATEFKVYLFGNLDFGTVLYSINGIKCDYEEFEEGRAAALSRAARRIAEAV